MYYFLNISLNIADDRSFSRLLRISNNKLGKISDDFFVISFFTFRPFAKRWRYNCTANFLSPFFHHSLNIFLFSHLFSTLTLPKLQLQLQITFYNCKLHFTTAEIVISCTLKYAAMVRSD